MVISPDRLQKEGLFCFSIYKGTNLQHHYFGKDFGDGGVEEVAHGLTIDADWKDILPHCAQLLQLMDDLQSHRRMITELEAVLA